MNTTIVDGQIVYRDREFTTIDEPEVLHEANEAFLSRARPHGRSHVTGG